ncbi:MAG: RNA 2',3'-cyclic phosphodiesterase [Rubrivivax sp.]|nr:RNA 2',3'-cyclic phosphodiesterase [Rubrivivax sp.]
MPEPPASLRLFVALWPDEAARAALVQWRDAMACPAPAQPTRRDKLHLTLHFIGAVAAARLRELADGLALPPPRFELCLDRIAAWHGGIVALQPTRLPEPLAELHGRLAAALRQLGLPVEARRFRPHVTLARHARAVPPHHAAPPPVRWAVDGYALVESTRAGDYVVQRRYAAP